MKSKIVLIVFCSWLFSTCADTENKKTVSEEKGTQETIAKKVSEIEPSLFEADSLQIIYYDNPDADSLRYSRYFTYMETGDTNTIKTLLGAINQVYVQQAKTRQCRSEGKLYFLKGEDILKTVYFSTGNDSCSYFYFIKDGSFIYLPLVHQAKQLLTGNRKEARKPA